ASHSPAVSPTRSATSASSAVPARDERPVPSALTSTVLALQRPITFTVNLLSGGIGNSTAQSSLLRRTFQTPSRPHPGATDESRLAGASANFRPRAWFQHGDTILSPSVTRFASWTLERCPTHCPKAPRRSSFV